MRDDEIMTLKNYRNAAMERAKIAERIERSGSVGGPRLMGEIRMDGMPRGTNNREAAAQQHIDYLEEQKQYWERQIEQMQPSVDAILRRIDDARALFVVESFFVRAETDERIAFALNCSEKTAYRIRRNALQMW